MRRSSAVCADRARFALAERIADDLLYAGYIVHPYEAAAVRGGAVASVPPLVPRGSGAAGGPTWNLTDCLIEAPASAMLTLRLRFLHPQERTVEDADGRPLEALHVGRRRWTAWREAVPRATTIGPLPLVSGLSRDVPFSWGAGRDVEEVRDGDGALCGRVVRTYQALDGRLTIDLRPADAFLRLRVFVENRSACVGEGRCEPGEPVGGEVPANAFLAPHLLLAVQGGAFIPAGAVGAEGTPVSCRSHHTWPVLVGAPGTRHLLLSSPIPLPDYPCVGPRGSSLICTGAEPVAAPGMHAGRAVAEAPGLEEVTSVSGDTRAGRRAC
ncbi:MAG: hypothetical protein AB7O67_17100 [Vicinamibacterales bacterium]